MFYFHKIYFNIILSCIPRSPNWSLPFRFSDENFAFLISPTHSAFPTHLFLPYLNTLIMFGEEYKLWRPPLCSFLHLPVTSLLHSNILLTNSMEQSSSWETTVTQLLKKLPAFYGTQRFIAVLMNYSTLKYPQLWQ